MDALQFTYWLNGFAELSGDEPPTPAQWRSIKEHLGLVFTKVTPQMRPGPIPLTDWQVPPSTTCAAGKPELIRAECIGLGWASGVQTDVKSVC